MKTPSPARVHILLAREASTAIVIRRGPAKQVCTLLWNRKNDTFTLGQWLKGRIYERKADLSPDGKHLIYFALGGGRGDQHHSWTALSRAPYLKAIGFWPTKGGWGGGGIFPANDTYWIGSDWGDISIPCQVEPDAITPAGFCRSPEPSFDSTLNEKMRGIHSFRLMRDGWLPFRKRRMDRSINDYFEKLLPGGWILRKTEIPLAMDRPSGKASGAERHQLLHPERGEALDFPDWEWADWDTNRLVWVEHGVLFAARLSAKGPGFIRQLYDFNPLKFEAIPAPY